MLKITITESLWINANPQRVWDFTQDYCRRSLWDPFVRSAEVLSQSPAPRVRVRGCLGLTCVLVYRLYRPPERTSLAMTEVCSQWLTGGGGAWKYQEEEGGTRWTQANTLILRQRLRSMTALARWGLRWGTRRAMHRAKHRIEFAIEG